MTGEHRHDLPGSWCLWECLFGPLGSSRDVYDNWDSEAALAPHRDALRAQGVMLAGTETEGELTPAAGKSFDLK
jgi:hypothetical protein